MPSFIKRGPYQYQVKIRRRGYPSISRTFESKEEAETFAYQIESEIKRGIFVSRKESENTTLSESLDRYITEHLPSLKTVYRETNRARAIQRDPISKRILASIRGKDIADFIQRRKSSGAGPKTIKLDLSLLSKLFNLCRTEWGMEGLSNPVEFVQKPKLPRGRDRRFLPEEEKTLFAACEAYGGILPHIVRFALETGMRRGKIAGMTWEMVDLKKRTATLPETKNGEKRIVPLSTEALRILSGLPRSINGKVWEMGDQSITQAFIRAVSRARSSYEKECQERGESRILPSWSISHSTISATKPPAGSLRRD